MEHERCFFNLGRKTISLNPVKSQLRCFKLSSSVRCFTAIILRREFLAAINKINLKKLQFSSKVRFIRFMHISQYSYLTTTKQKHLKSSDLLLCSSKLLSSCNHVIYAMFCEPKILLHHPKRGCDLYLEKRCSKQTKNNWLDSIRSS